MREPQPPSHQSNGWVQRVPQDSRRGRTASPLALLSQTSVLVAMVLRREGDTWAQAASFKEGLSRNASCPLVPLPATTQSSGGQSWGHCHGRPAAGAGCRVPGTVPSRRSDRVSDHRGFIWQEQG